MMYAYPIKWIGGCTQMNLQYLQDNYPKLILYMKEGGYTKSYINRVKHEIKQILSEAEAQKWDSYKAVYLSYVKAGKAKAYLSEKRSLLGTIERFAVNDQYPDGHQHKGIISREKYPLLIPVFKAIIDNYCVVAEERGKKSSTIYVESHNAASFLLDLQQRGFDGLEKITEDAVLSAFLVPENGLRRSCTYKKSIAAVLRTCIPQEPEVFSRILAFFPDLRVKRKNIQYLLEDEISTIKQALKDNESPLTLRDKAISM
jgi:hypothetical protein